jgi:(1->4)-alpha-D-glucan 1-alpha-D-glucosylmutase
MESSTPVENASPPLRSSAEASRVTPLPRIPVSTYRLQFHREFTFEDARRLVPYLAALGITECYSSPILTARPGSTHGYDICDHNRLNPELGSEADFDAFTSELEAHGLGQILDFVPNHMGIDPQTNRWWRDVLENGPSSPYARYFDVDWDPVKPELKGKVLLPILGDQYGIVLERGELHLALADGALVLRYFEHDLPISPRESPRVLRHRPEALENELGADSHDLREYWSIVTALSNLPSFNETDAARIAERQREKEVARERLVRLLEASDPIRRHLDDAIRHFNGRPGERESFDPLHELLEAQPYRLAFWRTAFHEINFRRFFDINDLAGIRVEDPEVFEAVHRLMFQLIRDRKVTGLRLDHLDGLFDPAAYLEALQRAIGPTWVVAEKILSEGEELPTAWAVHGTSGYDFLNDLNGVFVDPASAGKMRAIYERFTARGAPFPIVTYVCKKLISQTSLASELNVLAAALNRISERSRRLRDFTLDTLRDALREVVACFPVYRTYVNAAGASEADRRTIDQAIEGARRRNPAMEPTVFAFVRAALTRELPSGDGPGSGVDAADRFAMKFQQYTGPVQAKGLEDTAFYRHNPLVSLNEVGRPPAAFHQANLRRLARWPLAMLGTSTHDTKRGEDARARINVLAENPEEWRQRIIRWSRINTTNRAPVGSGWAPDRNDEYLFYQALLGAWPAGATEADPELVQRLRDYMAKAIREAKLHTSWINPNQAYEAGVAAFVEKTLSGATTRKFLEAFLPFQDRIARAGVVNSLSQVVLKVAAPGVPDFYRGTELWDLSLVDPDNRRPVDWGLRRRFVDELEPWFERERPPAQALEGMLREWHDGRLKVFVTACALRARRRLPSLFLAGEYVPLEADGDRREHVVAFARRADHEVAIVIAPRFPTRLAGEAQPFPLGPAAWADARLTLPPELAGRTYRNVFTREAVRATAAGHDTGIALVDAFASLPVALLLAERDA